eukprot:gene1391-32760_t
MVDPRMGLNEQLITYVGYEGTLVNLNPGKTVRDTFVKRRGLANFRNGKPQRGGVHFGPDMMPYQSDNWRCFETLDTRQAFAFLSATHSCSYMCAFSSFLNITNNHCLLSSEGADLSVASYELVDQDELEVLEELVDQDGLEVLEELVDQDELEVLDELVDQDELEVLEELDDQDELEVLEELVDQDELEVLEEPILLCGVVAASANAVIGVEGAHARVDSGAGGMVVDAVVLGMQVQSRDVEAVTCGTVLELEVKCLPDSVFYIVFNPIMLQICADDHEVTSVGLEASQEVCIVLKVAYDRIGANSDPALFALAAAAASYPLTNLGDS